MTNEEKFVNELIGYIFAYPDDDYMTMECLCRKLVKHGLLDKADGHYQTHDICTNTHECVKDTHDKTELTEPHIYGLFRKGELSDDDVKELKKQIGQIIEYADRKTENSSEKPNNFAKDINVRSKDEPQDDAEDQFCIEHNCPHFYQFGGCMNQGDCPYDEDEPQTERSE